MTVAVAGDDGEPRPALVVQADAFEAIPSVTLLRAVSQVMVDKAVTVSRAKVGAVIGRAGDEAMQAVDLALGRFLGVG